MISPNANKNRCFISRPRFALSQTVCDVMHIRLALALCCALAVTAIRVPGDADDLDVNSARR